MEPNAVVVGGGIAGPVTGVALRRAGLQATVFEAAPDGHHGAGAFLQLAPNGINALKDLRLDAALRDAGGFGTSGITFSNARGRSVGELDSSDELERYGAQNLLVKRAELHAALRSAAEAEGVRVVFGKRLTEYVVQGSRVEARFADGSVAAGDILIGCDGIGSRVRQQLLGPGPRPTYSGLMNLGGFAHLPLVDVGRNHMVFGRRAFFGYTPAPSGEVYWFSNIPDPDGDPHVTTTGGWLERARRVHADDPEPVRRILAAAPPPVGAWPIHDLPTLPTWHGERVCLVGDAAHAMSPSAGQGASVAIEDAVVLAMCLRDHPTPGAAFAAYERLRRPRAEAIVRQARRNGSSKIPGPVGGLIRDLLLPAFLRIGVKQAEATYAYRLVPDHRRRGVGEDRARGPEVKA